MSLQCVVHYSNIKIKSKVMPLDHHKFKILNDNKKAWERADTNDTAQHESQCKTIPATLDIQKHGAHRECFKKFTVKRKKSNIPVKITNIKRSPSRLGTKVATTPASAEILDKPRVDLDMPHIQVNYDRKLARRVIRDAAPEDTITNESSGLGNGLVKVNYSKQPPRLFTDQTSDVALTQVSTELDDVTVKMNGNKQSPRLLSDQASADAILETSNEADDEDMEYVVVDRKPLNREFTVQLTCCKDLTEETEVKEVIRMEDSAARFRKDVAFQMMLEGSVNGKSFAVEGKGMGKATSGIIRGRWECTTGTLPISWAAISATLGYSFKCFAYFPNGISHFFQECMPEGYTQERVTTFQEGGTIRSFHEVVFQKGIVVDNVTMEAEGFKSDSPLLSNGLKCFLPSTETSFPYENGVKSLVHHVYPVKFGSRKYIVATQATINRPIGNKRVIQPPQPYFTRAQVRQSKEVDDDTDHIIQEEIIEGYDFVLF